MPDRSPAEWQELTRRLRELSEDKTRPRADRAKALDLLRKIEGPRNRTIDPTERARRQQERVLQDIEYNYEGGIV